MVNWDYAFMATYCLAAALLISPIVCGVIGHRRGKRHEPPEV